MVVPFAPTAGWYRIYLSLLLSGLSEEEAVEKASSSISDPKSRARCVIAGNNGRLSLPIPVEGGSARLKKRSGRGDSEITLSEHGRWREVHKGALSAAYGKTPFYPHLYERIEEIYDDTEITSLSEFDMRVFREINRFLGLPEILRDIPSATCAGNEALRETAEEMKTKVNSDLSILDAVFRLGKDTLFGLI